MPPKMTEEQQKAVREYIIGKSADSGCSWCGNKSWVIQDIFVEVKPFNPGVFTIGGETVPLVAAVCENCTHMMFFSAIRMGVIKQDGPAVTDNEREGKDNE